MGWVWGDGDIPGGSFYIKIKKMCCCEGIFTYSKIVHLWFRARGGGRVGRLGGLVIHRGTHFKLKVEGQTVL